MTDLMIWTAPINVASGIEMLSEARQLYQMSTLSRWKELEGFCHEQHRKIARPLPPLYWADYPDWQSRVHHLFAEEAKHKTKLNAIMKRACDEGSWSGVYNRGGSLNFLCGARLLCAADTIRIILTSEPWRVLRDTPSRQEGWWDALRWLLLDSWNEWRWDTFLKLQALRSLSGDGDTFYGLPELPPKFN